MAADRPFDPASYFRDMLGEWEKMANSFGGDALKSEEFVRGMNGAQMAASAMQAQFREHMDRALEQSNLPSRRDLEQMNERLGRVEEALARIERHLGSAPATPRAKPTRSRKPPSLNDSQAD